MLQLHAKHFVLLVLEEYFYFILLRKIAHSVTGNSRPIERVRDNKNGKNPEVTKVKLLIMHISDSYLIMMYELCCRIALYNTLMFNAFLLRFFY